MSSFRLNLPVDIPWKLIESSSDMMDRTFCNKKFPPAFRSSIAVYAYEPDLEELPDEVACGQKLCFLKVSCTITGYQPMPEEKQQVVELLGSVDEVSGRDIEEITRTYFGCFGVMLHVGVFPYADDRQNNLDRYPRIVDFEPKVRDFYQAATETGDVLTSSFNKVSTGKSLVSTDSTQSTWKAGADVSIPKEVTGGLPLGLKGETGQVRTEADQENWQVQSDASRERREGQSTTTQLSQMYNLLTGYHAGTNRATFLMLPRPHVLQPTDRRTFVQGLRAIEGIQDFFLVVTRDKDDERLKVDVQLQTGHFPETIEVADVVPPEDQFERRSETVATFTKKCVGLGLVEGAVGAVGDGLGLTDAPFEETNVTGGPQVFDGFEVDGWEFDTSEGTSGHRALKEHKLDDDNLADFEGITISPHTYKKESPDKVTIDVRVKNANIWPADGASKAKFSRSYEVFLRRRKNVSSDKAANVAGLLITQRNLCAQIEFGECIHKVPLPADFQWPGVIIIDEPILDLSDLAGLPEIEPAPADPFNPRFAYARKKAVVRKIQAAMVTSGSSPFRYGLGNVGFLQSKHFSRKLLRILPARVLDGPASEVVGKRDLLPPNLPLRDLLRMDVRELARRAKISPEEALKAKSSLFEARAK